MWALTPQATYLGDFHGRTPPPGSVPDPPPPDGRRGRGCPPRRIRIHTETRPFGRPSRVIRHRFFNHWRYHRGLHRLCCGLPQRRLPVHLDVVPCHPGLSTVDAHRSRCSCEDPSGRVCIPVDQSPQRFHIPIVHLIQRPGRVDQWDDQSQLHLRRLLRERVRLATDAVPADFYRDCGGHGLCDHQRIPGALGDVHQQYWRQLGDHRDSRRHRCHRCCHCHHSRQCTADLIAFCWQES